MPKSTHPLEHLADVCVPEHNDYATPQLDLCKTICHAETATMETAAEFLPSGEDDYVVHHAKSRGARKGYDND